MAGASHPTATETVPLSVHNEGPGAVDVEVIVRGDGAVVHSVSLDAAETSTISAPAGASVEVYTPEGTATATATPGAFFVVRGGRVLVARK